MIIGAGCSFLTAMWQITAAFCTPNMSDYGRLCINDESLMY